MKRETIIGRANVEDIPEIEAYYRPCQIAFDSPKRPSEKAGRLPYSGFERHNIR